MNKVYGYVRVSTETQADKGYGLDTQRNAIIEHCKENDLELVEIFSDEGISGALGDADDICKRQGLINLLDTLNGTNTIIVMNTSRLWRDDAAKVYITREVRKLQGEIISIEQPKYSLYSKDPQDFIYNSLMEMLDQYDRLNINLKLAKGRSTKANKGDKPAGRLPYGYKYSENKKKVIIDQTKEEILKKIFKFYSYGFGYQKIADYLNNTLNVKTEDNADWNRSTIYNIIHNDFYKGIVTHASNKIKGNHQPIIDEEEWNTLQIKKEYSHSGYSK